jgi:hypothetical protein
MRVFVFLPRTRVAPDFEAAALPLVLDFAVDFGFAFAGADDVDVSAAGGVDRGAGVLPPSEADAPALDVALGRCGEVFAGAGVVADGSLAVGAERGGAFAYTGSEASTLTKTTAPAKSRSALVRARTHVLF